MIVTEIIDIIRKINRNWINPVAISWACTAEKVPSDFRQSIQVRHMQSRLFTEFSNSHFSLLRLSGLRHSSSSYQVQDVVSFWGESFVFLTGVLYLYMHFSNQYTLQAWINSFSYLFSVLSFLLEVILLSCQVQSRQAWQVHTIFQFQYWKAADGGTGRCNAEQNCSVLAW